MKTTTSTLAAPPAGTVTIPPSSTAVASGAKGDGISKVKLAVGAAGLFLFIVGVKRTLRTDDGMEYDQKDARFKPEPAKGRGSVLEERLRLK